MSFDPTLIAPYKSGLSQYYKPFLIGNDAFVNLVNCYSQRGKIIKREGSTVLARVPVWNTASAITNASPPIVTSVAHGLSNGDMVWLESVTMTNGTITNVTPIGNQTFVSFVGAPGILVNQTLVLNGVTGINLLNPNSVGESSFNGPAWTVTTVGINFVYLAVETTGTWGGGGTAFLGGLEKQAFYVTNLSANTFSLQYLNSALTNVPAAGTATSANIYLPIVGTRIFIVSMNGNEQLVVFTPKQAWLFNTSTNTFLNISFNNVPNPILWSGTKDSYVYTSNYATVMWATNNVFNTTNQPTGIRYWNGSSVAGWSNFQPQVAGSGGGSASYLNSALIIMPYKGRLVVLNTQEGSNAAPPGQGNINYFNRARWSQNGTPFVANPPSSAFGVDTNAWAQDIIGKGGYIDADTSETIVSAEIIQDTMIVNFQFSTWRLRYTGQDILPFVWERINTQFGSEATYSTVPFDDGALAISRRGIIKGGFNDVARIDMAIPDFVDKFDTGSVGEGLNRIQSVRDYQKRLVYWLYRDQSTDGNPPDEQTPNSILCFNYQDNTWSTFLQNFKTLGYYKQTVNNIWSTWTTPWAGDLTTWESPLDQLNKIIIVAGDTASNVWSIMNGDVSTDNGVNYNYIITTNLINPYFQQGKRCKLAFYDLYMTTTDKGALTIQNYTDDDPSDPWLTKTIDTSSAIYDAKYYRVYLGMIARNHQITLTMTSTQLNDQFIGSSPFELQGIIFHTRAEGRLKR